jgi:hypothetical protein
MAGLTKAQKTQREAEALAALQGQENATESLLVSMITDIESFPGAPKSADVHPNEVENWIADGWRIAE